MSLLKGVDGARGVCDWVCTHMDGTVGGIKGTRTRLSRAKVGVGKSGGACASRVINPTPRHLQIVATRWQIT